MTKQNHILDDAVLAFAEEQVNYMLENKVDHETLAKRQIRKFWNILLSQDISHKEIMAQIRKLAKHQIGKAEKKWVKFRDRSAKAIMDFWQLIEAICCDQQFEKKIRGKIPQDHKRIAISESDTEKIFSFRLIFAESLYAHFIYGQEFNTFQSLSGVNDKHQNTLEKKFHSISVQKK